MMKPSVVTNAEIILHFIEVQYSLLHSSSIAQHFFLLSEAVLF